jgi:branched-chain amino acid transport system substrate-binding protein
MRASPAGRMLASASAALLSLTGCFAAEAPSVPGAGGCGRKVAILGPLTGDSADLGANIRAGAQLAFDRHNSAHAGCVVELVQFDSQGDPKRAPALAQQIVADPGIIGVIGPAFSGESEAALPLLDQGGVTTITTSATRTGLTERGWGTFHRMVGNDAAQGSAAGRYIDLTLGAREVFVIDDASAYGRGLADQVVSTLGEKVVQRATVLPRQNDYTPVISQIRSAAAEVVFFGGYYNEAGTLLRQLRAAGLGATFVAGDAVKADGFMRNAGVAAEGAVITCSCLPPERAGEGFPESYRSVFNQAPGTNSAESYDAAMVFLAGIVAGNTTRPQMEAFVDGYSAPGVTTVLRWTPSGELIDSSVAVWVYRVRGGNFVTEQAVPPA